MADARNMHKKQSTFLTKNSLWQLLGILNWFQPILASKTLRACLESFAKVVNRLLGPFTLILLTYDSKLVHNLFLNLPPPPPPHPIGIGSSTQ